MEPAPRRDDALRTEAVVAVWRRWSYLLLALLLLVVAAPRAFAQAWVGWVHLGILALAVLETALLLQRPGRVHDLGVMLPGKIASLVQAGVAVALTGGTRSSLLLLYPTAMVAGILTSPRAADSLIAGGAGFLTYVVAVWGQLQQGLTIDRAEILAQVVLMFVFSLSVSLVANLLSEKNLRLERSKNALEKFAAGLKATNEKLERLSFTDAVTGVYNYRYFQLRLREEFSRARRYGLPLAVMMVDVDSFKQYNDSHGHPVGDRVLQAVATALTENVREFDTVCRYGGDEFAVVLSNAEADTAKGIGERIRSAVACCAQQVGAPGGITISLGVAVYPGDAETAEDLVQAADEALYRMKLSERGGVEAYVPMLSELRKRSEGEPEAPSLLGTLETLIAVINSRDRYTYGHSERVMRYAALVGQELGLAGEDQRLLRYAAFLHDIGKIEIGREILNKEGPLTAEERRVIKRHTLYGVQIVEPIRGLEKVVGIILHHHERFDGGGYPSGLAGEDIPYLARILALADAFDTMLSRRPYRPALTVEEALSEIHRGRGSQFDPFIAETFVRAVGERRGELGLDQESEPRVAENHRH